MNTYFAFKVLHIFAVVFVFFALGGLTLAALQGGGSERGRKIAGLTHGLALLVVLISGFGLLAQLSAGFGLWVWLKLAIWLTIGAMLAVVRRKPEIALALWFLLPILGGLAAYLAIYKPGL